MQCRRDHVLISKSLLNISKECVLTFAPNTDHSAVVTLVQSEELSRKPGPRFWKFNSSLLEDNEYVNALVNVLCLQRINIKTLKTAG